MRVVWGTPAFLKSILGFQDVKRISTNNIKKLQITNPTFKILEHIYSSWMMYVHANVRVNIYLYFISMFVYIDFEFIVCYLSLVEIVGLKWWAYVCLIWFIKWFVSV